MQQFKIYYSLTSPFAAKARMVAWFAGLIFDEILTDPGADPEDLLALNPLGKIPVLVGEDGPIFDSRLISLYLDSISFNTLYGSDPADRLAAQKLEALADGVCDCLLAHVMERRSRAAEHVNQALLGRYWAKIERSLDLVNMSISQMSEEVNVGHLAVRCMLGYLELRFQGAWEEGRGSLLAWKHTFDADNAELTRY
ncbi:glutathione S-transferase N-terminal domain-containing protein, partial [Pseudomonas syringae]|uniref:glutathione S-transferase N-terminal domain-containing protein n=1 Tax=Pseudomonas syringae TaxID=317 RepID=UPI00215B55AD